MQENMAKYWVWTFQLGKETEKSNAGQPMPEQEIEEEREALIDLVEYLVSSGENQWIQYFTFGRELGKTGNHHLQGYLQCHKQKRITALRKYFSTNDKLSGTLGFHWEKQNAKGKKNGKTANQIARDYCWKEGGYKWEWGTFITGGAGNRTDIHTVAAAIKGGCSRVDLEDNHGEMLIRYRGGMLGYLADMQRRRIPANRNVHVSVFHGRTNSGKTWKATNGHTHPSCYVSQTQLEWYCDYRRERRFVIDEFGNGMCSIRQLIKLIDGQRLKLKVKNSHTFAEWDEVIITTNLKWPEEIYTRALPAHRAALFRRINVVKEFTEDWDWHPPMARHNDPNPLGPYIAANGFVFPADET